MTIKRVANRKGQALVEAIISLTVLTIGLLGLLTLLSRSLSLNRAVANRYTATYLAAEGIEVVKSLIDANVIQGNDWNAGITPGVYELQFDDRALQQDQDRLLRFGVTSHRYGYGGGSSFSQETGFKRKIVIEDTGIDDDMRVISTVTWSDVGGASQVSVEDHFLNWRPSL